MNENYIEEMENEGEALNQSLALNWEYTETKEITQFEALLNKSMISDEEKELMRLHYIQKKDFRFIGDTLGYSEASIKAKHRKILKKLNKLL